MTENASITARGLKKVYGRRRPVLDQLDFTVGRGAAIGLLGANGTGKTTLLKCLLGLVPVDAGRCELLGEPSLLLSSAARGRIGYVPQAPGQFPWLSGRAMLRYIAAFYPVFDWPYARELAARWKLALRSPIGVLSPGQQQRLSIVRALATRPDVLILDEPIASLDPATRLAVIEELISERARRPLTVIFSSHLIGDLERLCSQFAVLANGRIAVMEDVAWFRQLVRANLESEEEQLAALALPAAPLVRKSGEGKRTVVLERSGIERLKSFMPARVRLTIDEPDVETLASEWMQ
jgi:ABC-2 type transport system ATP-binding protein